MLKLILHYSQLEGFSFVKLKTLLQMIGAPIIITTFLAGLGILKGEDSKQIVQKIKMVSFVMASKRFLML